MITEIFVLIPIVLMVVLFIVLSSYFENQMYAIGISLGVAGGVTLLLGKVGTKMGIFREENKVE